MKIERIREQHQALTAIAQRTLPTPTAINKVHFLLSDRFQRPFEATETGRNAVIALHPLPEDHEGDSAPLAILEARMAAINAYMQEDLPIRKIPDHMRLRSADLPKALKGDDGWKNADGLAQIRRMLGSLYVREGDELVTEQPEGFEGDEPAEAGPVDPMAEHTAET